MATNYPTSVDDGTSLPSPNATDKTNNPSHSALHGNSNDAIKALEAKVGTGATTPAANKVLLGTGSGTSAWQQLTSAELRGVLSDETGTGSAVFATTPTLTTPKVNTINEETAANGVTVDGLNIKDGKLNTNDSVVTANYTDGSIKPEHLVASSGTSWTWQDYVPTFTNVSGGSLSYARYVKIGTTIHVRLKYVLAGAGVSGAVTFTTPVTMHADYVLETPVEGTASFLDSGTNLYQAEPIAGSTTTIILRPTNASATNVTLAANTSSTVPFTWAANDEIKASLTFEAAA